jgi:esterase/lipase superfamily enzyme
VATVDCPPEFSGSCYPVWFGTNRVPVDPEDHAKGYTGQFDNTMHFGKRIVFIPDSHRAGELGSPLWKRLLSGTDDRIRLTTGKHLSADGFRREIRDFLARLDPTDQNILVFIHGFNTSFDEAARRSAQLGFDLRVPGITAFYSWPSRGRLSGYLTDLAAIEASEEHIASFLVNVAQLADRGKVHIIAHSMGNRGLLRALHRATAQAALQSGVRFGQIFLAAPDVDVNLFRQLAGIYPQVSERTTLYVADEDKALAAMEWIAQDKKAGSAPPLLILPGIDTVRVKGVGLFQLGHSYVAEQLDVLKDIRALLYWREPPAQRAARNRWPVPDQSAQAKGAWIIGE